MHKKIRAWIILALLLLADTTYTFMQHRMVGLDGDMPSLILPGPHYEPVLSAPFGWAAATGEAAYASPNRFFVHWAMYHYFRLAPAALGTFTDPIAGIFLSAAAAKTGAHLLLLLLLAGMAANRKGIGPTLAAAVLMAPLFQSAGYYQPVMGLIEQAPTYTFFYAWPAVLMLSWLALLCRRWGHLRTATPPLWETLSLYALTLIMPFTGPLVPGVIAVGFSIVFGYGGRQLLKKDGWQQRAVFIRQQLPLSHWAAIGLLGTLGLYSLYLGSLSTEQQEGISLWARYEKLPAGLWKMLTNKPGLPLLITGILLQFALLRRLNAENWRHWSETEIRYLLLFILLYILLIPLGGYRDYRPDIVRRDTLQPVLLILVYLWGKASLLLLFAANRKPGYWLPTVGLLLLFTVADYTNVRQPPCQEQALRDMAASTADTIAISPDCRVATWAEIPDQDTRLSSELLVLWGILEEGQYFEYAPAPRD
ncbi:MAG: hypothetical protein RIC19_14650 [Phaeodactylibacter sp.]|uniref:hypothetical protein n=1 Tax=Phaeodactylibacter sp. TaxID=1940289 RepID=UPI0032EF4A8B